MRLHVEGQRGCVEDDSLCIGGEGCPGNGGAVPITGGGMGMAGENASVA